MTDNQTKLLAALPADATATPAALAEATGLGYSTVTRLLRELADAGLATRQADGWRAGPSSEPSNAAGPTTPEPAPKEPDVTERTTPDAEPDAADRAREASGPKPSEAPPASGPDSPTHDGAHDGEPRDEAGTAGQAPTPETARLRKGQLREQVLAALRSSAEPVGPTKLAKMLDGRSQGAISNACDRLVQTGDAFLVSERPRRFRATNAT